MKPLLEKTNISGMKNVIGTKPVAGTLENKSLYITSAINTIMELIYHNEWHKFIHGRVTLKGFNQSKKNV